ncbi:hypothetical protein [Pseudomonas paeninsulae]|uniref:hypothetical protein n=1 Tax=Pseudomonas paeninsulae TaxID=3110772 RepID=UPI002D78C084|nr:hypothetical protein [Pseudomonas sp. IT1137]
MNLNELEQHIHDAIEAGDRDTLELYAEYAAERLNELGEVLCLAVIRQDLAALARAVEVIEHHVDRSRAAFTGALALKRMGQVEHEAQCRAELNVELRRSA